MRYHSIAFPPRDMLKIVSVPFSVAVFFEEQQMLTLTVTEGDNAGFKDTISYQAGRFSSGLFTLSWLETTGTTVVHVIDPQEGTTASFVTPKLGGFLRLEGSVDLSRMSVL